MLHLARLPASAQEGVAVPALLAVTGGRLFCEGGDGRMLSPYFVTRCVFFATLNGAQSCRAVSCRTAGHGTGSTGESVGDMASTVQELLDSLAATASETERRVWAAACARALGLGGMAVSLGRELVWFTDETSARLEDLQFVLGQGPGLFLKDVTEVREVPDLSRLLARQWPQYAAEAEELGIAALFVWPVHIGAVQAGTMTGYRRTTGPLSTTQLAQGWLVADALARHVLNRLPAVSVTSSSSSSSSDDGPGHAGSVELHRTEVHQATGVLSVRLGVPLAEALDHLRAQAYTSGLSLTDTAHAVLRRELPDDLT
ncbi:ANTAR domain-containing protein [Streptomyces sp. NPDC055210]